MTKNHLDDAIDRAVRDMMSSEPQPGFRRRVLDRIERGRTSRLKAAWIPALAGAAGVVVIAFAFSIVQRGSQTPARPSSSPVSNTVTAPSAPVPPAPQPERAVESGPRRVASAIHAAHEGRVVATSIDEPQPEAEDVLLEPLSTVAPLTVVEITEPRIAIRDISIGELSISPITVAPLPQSGGGASSPREDR